MKKHVPVIILLLLCQTLLFGQRTPEAEIEKIASSLAMQLKNKKVKMAAVADFTYQGQRDTRIGKYLADELSGKLTMQGFSMMNRDKVREGLAKYEMKKQAKNNAPSSQPADDSLFLWNKIGDGIKLIGAGKALKGVDAIIYGDIEDWEDDLRVVIQMTKNNTKGENIGAATGNFTKTPQIRRMLEGGVVPAQPPVSGSPSIPSTTPSSPTLPTGGNSIVAKHNNLAFEVVGCRQIGQDIVCNFNIVSNNADDMICTYLDNSKITDAGNGHEFFIKEMQLADAYGTGRHLCKTLVGNISIEASFKFAKVNQRVSMIARLDLKCWAQNSNHFQISMYNIPVR